MAATEGTATETKNQAVRETHPDFSWGFQLHLLNLDQTDKLRINLRAKACKNTNDVNHPDILPSVNGLAVVCPKGLVPITDATLHKWRSRWILCFEPESAPTPAGSLKSLVRDLLVNKWGLLVDLPEHRLIISVVHNVGLVGFVTSNTLNVIPTSPRPVPQSASQTSTTVASSTVEPAQNQSTPLVTASKQDLVRKFINLIGRKKILKDEAKRLGQRSNQDSDKKAPPSSWEQEVRLALSMLNNSLATLQQPPAVLDNTISTIEKVMNKVTAKSNGVVKKPTKAK